MGSGIASLGFGHNLELIQDPAMRSRILPLFKFDPAKSSDRPHGQGTTFRVDPWGGCATAFHVIEDMMVVANGKPVVRADVRLVALEMEGIAYGAAPLPKDAWRPLNDLNSLCAIDSPPFQPARLRNVSELVSLSILRSPDAHGPPPYLAIDFRWHPVVGERVTATGFAGLDLDPNGDGDDRPMSQYLYSSSGPIIDIQSADGKSGRPWPMIRVAANWPGGMSGGPIFNAEGNVVGLVSTGIATAGVGTATFFRGGTSQRRRFRNLILQIPVG